MNYHLLIDIFLAITVLSIILILRAQGNSKKGEN